MLVQKQKREAAHARMAPGQLTTRTGGRSRVRQLDKSPAWPALFCPPTSLGPPCRAGKYAAHNARRGTVNGCKVGDSQLDKQQHREGWASLEGAMMEGADARDACDSAWDESNTRPVAAAAHWQSGQAPLPQCMPPPHSPPCPSAPSAPTPQPEAGLRLCAVLGPHHCQPPPTGVATSGTTEPLPLSADCGGLGRFLSDSVPPAPQRRQMRVAHPNWVTHLSLHLPE